jgi:replicative DNA helicase
VLGCILAGENAEPAKVLTPSSFHVPAHRATWEAIQLLLASGTPVDELTVADRLKASGKLGEAGGPSALVQLTSGSPVLANVPSYVAILRDRATRREILSAARLAAAGASDLSQDITSVALQGSDAFARLGAAGATELPTLETAFATVLDEMQAIAAGTRQGIYKTGIDVWDELLGGLPAGYLSLIGAYPSVGKSALKNRMLINLARSGVKVGTFELEDPVTALVYRAVARETGIPVRRLRTERLPEFLMMRVGEVIQREYAWAANVVYENRSRITVAQIAAQARQMVTQRGCRVLFVDHFGLIDFGSDYGRIDYDIEMGVNAIAAVAKELDVAIVGLVHFRRPKSGTDDEPRYIRPTSGFWKNSGGFEQRARLCAGLWLNKDMPGQVITTVLKQTEGDKDFDFVMPLHQPSGLIESEGGRKGEGRQGYHEKPHWSGEA